MLVLFVFALVELLGKIILHTHLTDGMQLAFQIIDMLFFVAQDLFEERTGCVVPDVGGDPDRVIQLLHGVHLQRQVAFELRLNVGSYLDGPDIGHIRGSVEEQNSVHQLFGMNHFFDGLFAVESSEPEVAPVLAHLRMEEVLVNGSELRLKRLAQILENFIVSAHPTILAAGVWPFNSGWCAAISPRNDAEGIGGCASGRSSSYPGFLDPDRSGATSSGIPWGRSLVLRISFGRW
jgi:hypothetical protein